MQLKAFPCLFCHYTPPREHPAEFQQTRPDHNPPQDARFEPIDGNDGWQVHRKRRGRRPLDNSTHANSKPAEKACHIDPRTDNDNSGSVELRRGSHAPELFLSAPHSPHATNNHKLAGHWQNDPSSSKGFSHQPPALNLIEASPCQSRNITKHKSHHLNTCHHAQSHASTPKPTKSNSSLCTTDKTSPSTTSGNHRPPFPSLPLPLLLLLFRPPYPGLYIRYPYPLSP